MGPVRVRLASVRWRPRWRLAMAGLAAAVPLVVGLSASQPAAAANGQPRHEKTVLGLWQPGGSVSDSPQQLSYEQAFRQQYGLRADLPYIRSLHALSAHALSAHQTVVGYGVLLTPQEAAELSYRQQLAEVITPGHPFYAYLEANSADFAGEFIDQPSGGIVTVLFAKSVEAHRSALVRLFPDAARLRVASARYTWNQLLGWSAAVAAATPRLRAAGVPLISSGPDVRTNSVSVGLVTVSSSAENSVRAAFPGIPLNFTAAPVVRPTGTTAAVAPPMDAGEGIWETENGGDGCTSGFALDGPNGTWGNLYMLTAGHCGPSGDLWIQGPQPGSGDSHYIVGPETRAQFGNEWGDGTTNDASVINVEMQGDVQPDILISTYSCGFLCTGYNIRIVHGQESNWGVVGETACQSGAYSGGEHCGTIQQIDFCYTYTNLQSEGFPNNSAQVCNLSSGYLNSISGDSGSPVYQPQTSGTSMAQGVMSGGGSGGFSQWVAISPALSVLNGYSTMWG